jgi:hypothetical protein
MSPWKGLAIVAAAAFIAWLILRPEEETQSPERLSGGASGGGFGGGSGGASGGVSAAVMGDTSALAEAVAALARGVQVPALKTATATVSAGTTELVAAEGGKTIRVLAYAVTGPGSLTFRFLSNGTPIWALALDVPAGNSGANLSAAWPAYLMSSDQSGNLQCQSSGNATVSVTYWVE